MQLRNVYTPIYAVRSAQMVLLAYLAATLAIAAPQDNSTNRSAAPAVSGSIQGKLWVVDAMQASNAVFPAPAATPDATFSTNSIAYQAQQVGTSTAHCFTIQSFLRNCGTNAYGLTFSGLPNSNLGGSAAGPSTPINGNTWGILIEFTGSTSLTNGGAFYLVHDDGVSLNIDGTAVPNLSSGQSGPRLDCATFTGTSGTHSHDLLYGNIGPISGDQAFVIFSPAVPNSGIGTGVTCANQAP